MASKKITAPKRKLNDGHEMPVLGLGTFLGTNPKGGLVKVVEGELSKLVELAIDAGYRQIDTAAIYETEEEVGKGVRNKIADGTIQREDVFVTTKLWNDQHARNEVVPALKKSLNKLGLDYVDLYLMHWPMAYTINNAVLDIDYLDTWKGMEEAKKLGLAKSIGISNFNEEQIERVLADADIKPAVLQVELDRDLMPIPKSTNPERIIQNLDVFDFQLSEEETIVLEAFNRDYRVVLPSFWQTHPYYPFEHVESPAITNPLV